jgi:hypothetical protein
VAEQALDRIGEPWETGRRGRLDRLQRDYGDRVPVLLLDGREHGYWRSRRTGCGRDLARPPGAPPW